MDLGAIVEVAIGIVFMWITISLATIQIQEWITTKLDKRARDMEASIHEILANPNLRSQLYDHPIIRGLTSKKRRRPSIVPPRFYTNPLIRGFTQEKRKLPSYIPAQQFALSLFDIAMTAGTESSLIQQGILKIRDDLEKGQKLATREKGKEMASEQTIIDALNILADLARSAAATEAGTSITNISLDLLKKKADEFSKQYPEYKPVIDRALAEAKLIKIEIEQVARKQKAANGDDAVLTQLRDGIAALSVISPELNQTLSALLLNIEQYVTSGESNLARARQTVEKWFDDSMDRASGVFKRYSQAMALFIGIIVAFALNVDSINLTLYLWREPSVRQVLAANAANFQLPEQQLAANPEKAMQAFRNQFVGLNLPIGWVLNGGKPEDLTAMYDSECQLFPDGNQAFGIPVFGSKFCISPSQSNNQTNIALKIFGILITAFAARQGAPFWFDLLKRLVNVRSTGANPAEKEAGK
jgi:hypothetical protein